MLVLKIIGVLIALFLVYKIIVKVNEFTIKKYRYEFFNMGNFIASAIGYGMIYFGSKWYMSALDKQGDTLNGIILFTIGIILILAVIYINVTNTSLSEGLGFSLLQAPIYSVLSIAAIFALIAAIAYFSETKPVYQINNDE